MKFSYEGHDKMGKPLKGDLEASSQEDASAELRAQGIFAMRLEPAGDEPMKTVLEHTVAVLPGVARSADNASGTSAIDQRFVTPPDAGMVEDEIEKVVQEGNADMRVRVDCGIEPDILRAVEIAKGIKAVVQIEQGRHLAERIYGECLKEMLVEIAVRRFHSS